MKRFMPAIVSLVALAAAAFAYVQYAKVSDLRRQIAGHTIAREAALRLSQEAAEELARVRSDAEIARDNIGRLTAERDAALAKAKAGSAADEPGGTGVAVKAEATAPGKTMMSGFAKMFSTDEGKKMMRSQMAMGLKMQFGGMARDLKLDPKVADQVMAILGDRQAAIAEVTFGAMGKGGMDEGAGAQMAADAEKTRQEYNERLKEVLGEQGMDDFRKYERSLGDRMLLSMHEQQFTSAGSPLETGQRDALLEIMSAERAKTPESVFENGANPGKAVAALGDTAAVEKWLKQEEGYQERVLQASRATLNPDQVNALRDSFKQQNEMKRFGIRMSAEMFKAEPAAGAAVK